MDCKFYDECRKSEACGILGECVFGHQLILDSQHPAATIGLHYGKTIGAINNVFHKVKYNKKFNGCIIAAQDHLDKIPR
jgi:hypothetical protein